MGELRLPVWGPQTTTECRLLVNCSGPGGLTTVKYDHGKVSQQLFYFNTVTRISIYPRPDASEEPDRISSTTLLAAGLCRCFDCSREVVIISAYLRSRQPNVPSEGSEWAKAVADFSRELQVAAVVDLMDYSTRRRRLGRLLWLGTLCTA